MKKLSMTGFNVFLLLLTSCGCGGEGQPADAAADEGEAPPDQVREPDGEGGEDVTGDLDGEVSPDQIHEVQEVEAESIDDGFEVEDGLEADGNLECDPAETYGEMTALMTDLHAAITAEDLAALMGLFGSPAYDPGGDLSFLNAGGKTLPEIQDYFSRMLASLQDISFDALVTGDGAGNPYWQADAGTAFVADFTPLHAVVENPLGGYSYVDTMSAGDEWYEEKTEDWYSFRFVCYEAKWVVGTFGIGNQ